MITYVRTLKILYSMSEFGGLQKHEHSQHALVGPVSTALAAAVLSVIGEKVVKDITYEQRVFFSKNI